MEKFKELESQLKNGFFYGYQCGSASMINNFLHDTKSELTKQKYIDIDIDSAWSETFGGIFSDKKQKPKEKIITDPVIYFPIDPKFIEKIIEIDTVFRASESWNEQVTVYRGAPRLDKNALSGLVSTSIDADTAKEFYKGALIVMNLPKGFPYISLESEGSDSCFDAEKEIVLPPCEFEIVREYTLPHIDFPDSFPEYYKTYEVKPKAKSLAECFLDRMKNPPDDYFKGAICANKGDFKKAMEILKKYVKDFVKKGKLKMPSSQRQPGEEE